MFFRLASPTRSLSVCLGREACSAKGSPSCEPSRDSSERPPRPAAQLLVDSTQGREARGVLALSEQGDGLGPRGVEVLGRGDGIQGCVRGVETRHLQVWQGVGAAAAAAAAGDGGEAWGGEVAVRERERGVAEGPQRFEAEAFLLHLFPDVSFKTTKVKVSPRDRL